MVRTAFITGVTGQDGSYLAELLLTKGYCVHSHSSRSPGSHLGHAEPFRARLKIHHFELTDHRAVKAALEAVSPDEIYLLASQSRIPLSWSDPAATLRQNVEATAVWLDAMRSMCPNSKLVFASSSEVFDPVASAPTNEDTPLRPATPYGTSKACGQHLVKNFRDEYGIFASSAILFNHESPRRSPDFLWPKICKAATDIAARRQTHLTLGNLDVVRDWGYAPEYVEGLWRIALAQQPDDFVLGTGVGRTVREVVDLVFGRLGLDPSRHVQQTSQFTRASDAPVRIADPSKARTVLGWKPKVSFPELVNMMVDAELAELDKA